MDDLPKVASVNAVSYGPSVFSFSLYSMGRSLNRKKPEKSQNNQPQPDTAFLRDPSDTTIEGQQRAEGNG